MHHSLALITKGSVRTLVRSVEESTGAEAWRQKHSRYAPDAQNRQYALMQKIMMPAKLWCDRAEGVETGLRVWELDVREWQRVSGTALVDAVKYTVMMNMAPFFSGTMCSWALTPTVPLFEQLCCNGVFLPETLDHLRPCQLQIEQVRMTAIGSKLTCLKEEGWAQANNTRQELAQTAQATPTSTLARTVVERDTG